MSSYHSTTRDVYDAASLSSGNDADTSSLGSMTSSFFDDGRYSDSSHYDAMSLENASLGPNHAPLMVPFEAQARINAFLEEQGASEGHIAVEHSLIEDTGRTPVLTGNVVLDENDEIHLETFFNEVDEEQEAINEYVRNMRLEAHTPSLANSSGRDSDDDAMSIIDAEDIPNDIVRIFRETEHPGVFDVEYRAVHEHGKSLVDGHDGSDHPDSDCVVREERTRLESEPDDVILDEYPFELFVGSDDASLRDDKTDPCLSPRTTVAESVNESTYRVLMYALKWLASNPLHVANRYDNMPHDLLEDLCIVLSRFLPNDFARPRYEPVAAVLRVAVHVYGLDWLLRFNSGRVHWVRDTDLWQSPNGRLMVALWWATRRRALSLADIDHLLSLPQYELEDGYVLRTMREKLINGEMLPPRFVTTRL